MSGVVFSHSHIALQLWFYAMLHFANSSEGISGPFLARQLGVSGPTAFRVAQRIRAHMAAIDEQRLLGAAGETVIVRLAKILRIANARKNVQNNATVLLMCDGSRVNSTIIVGPSQKRLRAVIAKKLWPLSLLLNDCYFSFRVLSNYSLKTPIADFAPDYVFEWPPHENFNLGFLQYLNLSFADQFRGVSLDKAWLYLKEYEFRYNRRARSKETFSDLISYFPSLDEESLTRIKAASFVEAAV